MLRLAVASSKKSIKQYYPTALHTNKVTGYRHPNQNFDSEKWPKVQIEMKNIFNPAWEGVWKYS